MKQNFHSCCGFLFFFIFLITSQTSARFLATKQGVNHELVKFNNLDMEEGSESLEKLMGLEECKNGDEGCLKRRSIAEVHLDYIYTQQHKP